LILPAFLLPFNAGGGLLAAVPPRNHNNLRRGQTVKGHVARLVRDKGFGFITTTEGDGKDLFFHRSAVGGHTTFEQMQEGGPGNGGTPVEFDSVDSPKGPRAENVRATD
jgi:cold shock CspA family protein